IAGWERITSWVAARQARMITELARRRELGRLGEFVADEVAARLATTRAVAERKVSLATCLDAMPELADALHAGAVDVRKAVALIDTTDHLPLDTARELVAAALPDATELTVPQLRARIRRLDLTRDPAAADHRHTHARAQRHVTLTPAPDSMAWLSAYLPADDALRVFTALDALAGSSATDDSTGVDARRADALSDTFTRILDSGLAPSGESLPTRQRVRPHLQVTAAATTLLGLDDVPAELAGYGPIPAAMARSIAADATWRRIFTDPATGSLTGIGPRSYRPGADLTATVLARDTTCTFPGCRTPSYRCDVDHVEPFDPTRPGDAQTTCANLHALCRHHHRLKTHTGWTVVRKEETGATHWTAPTGHRYRRPTIAADPSHPSVQPTAPPATGPPNP
ncbi:HNH endonuclease signature motif containing protein, partial [Cellulomonas fimi]